MDGWDGAAADLTATVVAARIGDEDAFRRLYRLLRPALVRYLRALVGADADEVASATWQRLARELTGFDGDGDAFRGWAATLARQQALDHQRRHPRAATPAEPPPGDAAKTTAAKATAAKTAAAKALEEIGTDDAIALVAGLPPDQAEAILLRVVLGLDADATARVLGRRPGAVRAAGYRGLRRLARELAPLHQAAGNVPVTLPGRTPLDDFFQDPTATRSDPVTRATAERLLSGAADDLAATDLVAAVLALTTAPPRPAELTGEADAVTTFLTARTSPPTTTTPDDQPATDQPVAARRWVGGSRARVVKVGVVAALVVVVGSGLAVAAGTGYLGGQRPAAGPVSGRTPSGSGSGSSGTSSPSASAPGMSGAPGVPPATDVAGRTTPSRQPPAGTPSGQPHPAPSVTPSPRPTGWPTLWPSWTLTPSPTKPTKPGRPSPSHKGH